MSQYLLRIPTDTRAWSSYRHITPASIISIAGVFRVVLDIDVTGSSFPVWSIGGIDTPAAQNLVVFQTLTELQIRLGGVTRFFALPASASGRKTYEIISNGSNVEVFQEGVSCGTAPITSLPDMVVFFPFPNTSRSADLYGLQVEVNGTLIHNYDPSASNGTGTTLFDTQGNNNGTLVNFTVPDCWVLIPSAGVTVDGNFTLPAPTVSGTASATTPAFTANGNFTLPALTLSGTASASLPQPIATGNFTLPSLTLAGNAQAALPQPQITGAFTMPALSISGVVQVTQPNFNIVGNFTLPALTLSGEASATQPQPSINGSFTLPAISVSGFASATLPNPVAVGAFTLPALTINSSASVTEPVFTVNGSFTLPAITLSGQASATLPQPQITGSFTMPALQINGVAIVGGVAIIDAGDNIIYEPRLSNEIYEPRLSNIIRG